jgi:hypothetical protein
MTFMPLLRMNSEAIVAALDGKGVNSQHRAINEKQKAEYNLVCGACAGARSKFPMTSLW